MNHKLSLNDHKALSYLAEEGPHLTCRVAYACGMTFIRRRTPAAAYTMLRRLERWGYVEKPATTPGGYALWRITDAGRNAVQP
ncbi:DNA-binding PadR family transcriptional regulator [Sphingobium wenxiniae]|uniref:Uncharacterized protein n=1 Tax=Sphingobium wenxiniae (strain DSM 21828 / CGMCC 1.7748 / JZ-1) TaxID=595605 RepID=A0A562KCV1_SPHWJ|nr:hypothetical protein [Sphingobium wenxiniae]MBB6191481.1 DNA-binding PadR family transcriptional regulator [Sphingobium wenxiniae]TWH93227.1 hypothetical protein IQ35_02134 [Sphingobium wenxiniae]